MVFDLVARDAKTTTFILTSHLNHLPENMVVRHFFKSYSYFCLVSTLTEPECYNLTLAQWTLCNFVIYFRIWEVLLAHLAETEGSINLPLDWWSPCSKLRRTWSLLPLNWWTPCSKLRRTWSLLPWDWWTPCSKLRRTWSLLPLDWWTPCSTPRRTWPLGGTKHETETIMRQTDSVWSL